MTSAHALDLFAALLRVTIMVAGPILLASLVTGLTVGILQAATQINEASISFVAKVIAVTVMIVAVGPTLTTFIVDYTRQTIGSIAFVVRE